MADRSRDLRENALKGGTRYLPKLHEQHKLTARERLDLLLDEGSFVEDGLFANVTAEELPADGVVTGLGTVEGRQVAVMANDPTVKAGSWGARTVEKIIRIQETATKLRVPLFYLVDSAGARITDQIEMFPGRRHAGRIFFNEVQLSGFVPQICMLFGPSAAGGAYIPAFCDVVIMDEGSWLEIKKLFARELLTGFGRLDGQPVGILANQPMQKGGVLFNDSADKAARFIWLCDAFEIPLLFLADVPGFMIGTDVEKHGIIRHGAKMISAVSEATVPKISVIVRKAYGAGLYAMAGPAFDSDAVPALPSAQIAVMGPEPAVNAVFYNKLAELPEDQRAAKRKELEEKYREDVDLYKLASNLIVDDVVEPEHLRETLIARFRAYSTRVAHRVDRKHGVFPV